MKSSVFIYLKKHFSVLKKLSDSPQWILQTGDKSVGCRTISLRPEVSWWTG